MPATNPFHKIVDASERVAWRLDEVLGPDDELDFGRSFLPEGVARVSPLSTLSAREQLALNQIRAHGYLCFFAMFEEAFLPLMLDELARRGARANTTTRALLRFADEEIKHIQLFRRFRERFEAGFGTTCPVIGPPEALTARLRAQSPLALALLTLHIEWMTQCHYVDSVRDDAALDPLFVRLLRSHWVEEAQHARIDALVLRGQAAEGGPAELATATAEYLETCAELARMLGEQAAFDLDSLGRASGRAFRAGAATEIRRQQEQAWRWTILGSGMTHPKVRATLDAIDPALGATVALAARPYQLRN